MYSIEIAHGTSLRRSEVAEDGPPRVSDIVALSEGRFTTACARCGLIRGQEGTRILGGVGSLALAMAWHAWLDRACSAKQRSQNLPLRQHHLPALYQKHQAQHGCEHGRTDKCWQYLSELDGNLEAAKDFEQLPTWISVWHLRGYSHVCSTKAHGTLCRSRITLPRGRRAEDRQWLHPQSQSQIYLSIQPG